MPTVRVRRGRGPLAFVPLENNQVAVVPTRELNLHPEDQPRPGADQWVQVPLKKENDDTISMQSEPCYGEPRVADRRASGSTRPRPRSRTLASIFGSSNRISTDSQPPPIQPRPQPQPLVDQQPPTTNTRNGRRRSSSWVTDSIFGNPRLSQSITGEPLVGEPARLRSGSVGSAERPQVGVTIPAVSLGGRVGSALSLDEQPAARGPPSLTDSEHHLNEIVDHLDVIDAHIATVSHLSNAANSILIPPLSFYSRKPTIPLPVATKVQPLKTIDSEAALPQDESRDELDDHVEDVLSKRIKFRRAMAGTWAYLKTPMGIVTAIYGFLVVFWGAAIVLFLGKLINLHNDDLQSLWVEISSQIVNGLFTITGVGFIPWRLIDTYHIYMIWKFRRLNRKLRNKAGLPPLGDDDDIPDPAVDPAHIPALSEVQLQQLRKHQEKFQKSQTWYRPHATSTHKAFSINMALLICLFVDGNSVFQCILCGVMWGLTRFTRPGWVTGTLVGLSCLCGIMGGILIWRGGERAKKTEEVEARLREALQNEKTVLKEKYGVRTSTSIDGRGSMGGRPSKDIGRGQDGLGSPLAPGDDGLQILVPVADGPQGQKTLRTELVGTDAPFRPGAGGPLTRDRPTSLITETMEIPEKIPEAPEDSV